METQAINSPDPSKMIQHDIQNDGEITNLINRMNEILNTASRSIVLTAEGELIHQMDVSSQMVFDQLEINLKARIAQIKNYYER